jgi:hypothetical protein
MDRDRDYDGVPDWQEEANYADEAPVRGPWRTRYRRGGAPGGAGCALPVALLLAAAGTLTRLAPLRRRA